MNFAQFVETSTVSLRTILTRTISLHEVRTFKVIAYKEVALFLVQTGSGINSFLLYIVNTKTKKKQLYFNLKRNQAFTCMNHLKNFKKEAFEGINNYELTLYSTRTLPVVSLIKHNFITKFFNFSTKFKTKQLFSYLVYFKSITLKGSIKRLAGYTRVYKKCFFIIY